MKQKQWMIAALVLAAMVFVVTFAMNYLGGRGTTRPTDGKPIEARSWFLLQKNIPHEQLAHLEREEKTAGHIDYWFCNTNPDPIKVGLDRKNCSCTSVEAFVLPKEGTTWVMASVCALVGNGTEGVLSPIVMQGLYQVGFEKGLAPTELLRASETVTVPAGAFGWIRLRFSGEKSSQPQQSLVAMLWMDKPDGNSLATLDLRLVFFPPLRSWVIVRLGTLRDEELRKGAVREFLCWSSTRSAFRLDVAPALPRSPGSDPIVIGTPQLLTRDQMKQLEKEINDPETDTRQFGGSGGPVRCAYRIPITLREVAEDGKTPFDLGPFRRRLLLSSPDMKIDPRSVVVLGRVRGVVEFASEEDGGEMKFGNFAERSGKRDSLQLYSTVKGLKLEVDRARTWELIDASLAPGKESLGNRQSWTLRAQVKPGKASGAFPRIGDPLYEDCAVYLLATVPGEPPRTVRIAVSGTADATVR